MCFGCSYSGLEYWSGSHRIVLTRCLLMDRRFCDAFFVYSPLVEDVVADSKPYWNGEDIFMSLVSYKVRASMLVATCAYRQL